MSGFASGVMSTSVLAELRIALNTGFINFPLVPRSLRSTWCGCTGVLACLRVPSRMKIALGFDVVYDLWRYRSLRHVANWWVSSGIASRPSSGSGPRVIKSPCHLMALLTYFVHSLVPTLLLGTSYLPISWSTSSHPLLLWLDLYTSGSCLTSYIYIQVSDISTRNSYKT